MRHLLCIRVVELTPKSMLSLAYYWLQVLESRNGSESSTTSTRQMERSSRYDSEYTAPQKPKFESNFNSSPNFVVFPGCCITTTVTQAISTLPKTVKLGRETLSQHLNHGTLQLVSTVTSAVHKNPSSPTSWYPTSPDALKDFLYLYHRIPPPARIVLISKPNSPKHLL